MLQTEFEFTLPKGYVDRDGNLHRRGIMRLATALDEIRPLQEVSVQRNQAYLVVILLARVIIKLGELRTIDVTVVERLFSADLAYLQDFYRRINSNGHSRVRITCPECEHEFAVDDTLLHEEEGLAGE